MSAAVLEAPRTLFAAATAAAAAAAPASAATAAPAAADRPHLPRGRRSTLEELLDRSWRSARANGEADCPVCEGTMHLDGPQARCGGCGTTLG